MGADRKRHGLHRLTVAIKTRDLRALDRRCAGAKALLRWRADVLEALGGPDAVSPQKMALVEIACRQRLLLDSADEYLLGLQSIVNRKGRHVHRVVLERQTIADSLLRILIALGLERQKKVTSLSEYLAAKEAASS